MELGKTIKSTQEQAVASWINYLNQVRIDRLLEALSREDILQAVWGRDYFGELKIVDVNIRRLRIKIEDDSTNPTYITTVWGFGYKWGVGKDKA